MVATRAINFQLCDPNGKAVLAAGGMAQICQNGSPDSVATIYDITQAVISQPVSLTRGMLYVEVPKASSIVDIYLATPTGQFLVLKNVIPGDRQEQRYNPLDLVSQWVIPFSIANSTANVEKDTGFDFPVGALIDPSLGLEVTTVDAARTINTGILSTEPSGNASGFLAAPLLTTIGSVRVSLLNGSQFQGALVRVQDSVNAGDLTNAPHVVLSTSRSISYTLSAGTTTAKGFVHYTVKNILNANMQA